LFAELSNRIEGLLVVEMNSGQMLDDVLLSLEHQIPVEFFGRMGGAFAFPEEILTMICHLAEGKTEKHGHPRDHWLRRMLNEA
jgi:2-oxoglutarate/2-oxoacid ferredoxin oxidoreductase subunit alpha